MDIYDPEEDVLAQGKLYDSIIDLIQENNLDELIEITNNNEISHKFIVYYSILYKKNRIFDEYLGEGFDKSFTSFAINRNNGHAFWKLFTCTYYSSMYEKKSILKDILTTIILVEYPEIEKYLEKSIRHYVEEFDEYLKTDEYEFSLYYGRGTNIPLVYSHYINKIFREIYYEIVSSRFHKELPKILSTVKICRELEESIFGKNYGKIIKYIY